MGKYYGVTWTDSERNSLSHHGILGQKWGVRRYQNEDGTLTDAGKKRYGQNLDEVRANMEKAQKKETQLRRRAEDLNSRTGLKAVLTTNDFKNSRAKKKAVKASKKAAEIEKIYENMKGDNVDYRNEKEVNELALSAQEDFKKAARDPNVYKKYGVSQDTAFTMIEENKKYKNMVDHVLRSTKEVGEKADSAWNEAKNSKETRQKSGPKHEAFNRANLEYWKTLSDSAKEYIEKNFSGDEKDIAAALIFWRFIDW